MLCSVCNAVQNLRVWKKIWGDRDDGNLGNVVEGDVGGAQAPRAVLGSLARLRLELLVLP